MAVVTNQPVNLSSLQAQLLTSGLQIKDNPLYQVISQLLAATLQLQAAFSADIVAINNSIATAGATIPQIAARISLRV